MRVTGRNSAVEPWNVTAVLPDVGAVKWPSETLDQRAFAWLQEHAPKGVAWQLPLFRPSDTRVCAGCSNKVPWQQCQYSLWARMWCAHRRAQGVSVPVP